MLLVTKEHTEVFKLCQTKNLQQPCLISRNEFHRLSCTSINPDTRMQSSTQLKTPENKSDSLHFSSVNFYP